MCIRDRARGAAASAAKAELCDRWHLVGAARKQHPVRGREPAVRLAQPNRPPPRMGELRDPK
eukprot:2806567-Pyramimonas_sp.AAC.1